MKKELYFLQMLLYYDEPQLFLMKDMVDTKYLCLLVNVEENMPIYLGVAIHNNTYLGFINGKLDLRKIYEKPLLNEYFISKKIYDNFIEFELYTSVITEDFLPQKDFYFQFGNQQTDDTIQSEVCEKQNTVIQFSISDTNDNYEIAVDDLANTTKYFQGLFRNTYKKVSSSSKKTATNDERATKNTQNHILKAFKSSQGSFRLHFYVDTPKEVDLFNATIIDDTLFEIDNFFIDNNPEEKIINQLKRIRGHAVTSLKFFLETIIKSELTIKYTWFSPSQIDIHKTIVDSILAKKLYSIIISKSELTEEIVEIEGVFTKIDTDKKTWRINNATENKDFSGISEDVNYIKGMVITDNLYKLKCIEVTEETKISDKESIRYILKEIPKKL